MIFENALAFLIKPKQNRRNRKQKRIRKRERERNLTWAYLRGLGAGPAHLAVASRLPPLPVGRGRDDACARTVRHATRASACVPRPARHRGRPPRGRPD